MHLMNNGQAVLNRLRWRAFCNSTHLLFRQSFLRAFTVLLCCGLIWFTLFIVSYLGFHELRYTWRVNIDRYLIGIIFNLTFIALSVLLLFSTGIILYSSLFTSKESAFLLVTPITADQIFAYKYQSAVGFSSWAFLLLGSPMFVAYGLVVSGGAPWYYYLLLPFYFLGFVLLPGSVGALICMLLVNFFPRKRKQAFWLLGLVFVGLLIWAAYALILRNIGRMWASNTGLNDLLAGLSLVQSPFLPANWIAQGFRNAAIGEWQNALYYLALIWSNGLLLYLIAAWTAGKLYRRGFDLLVSGSSNRRKYGASWLDYVFTRAVAFLDPETRMLIQKDFRTFRRDPAQWAQIVIFLALAILYFSNVRGFYQQDIGRPFQNGISLLNLAATGFLMCAYTGRFIYPMLSLEGRKFWILGLLPLDRSKLLWGKFYFSAIGTLCVGEFLVIFSNVMLNMPWIFIVLHSAAIAVLALGMSGLSVGMGALMPNFREHDPSKIAVGFGGTVTLIVGLLFELVVIGFMVLPWHLALAVQQGGVQAVLNQYWLWIGVTIGLVCGIAAISIPMKMGSRAFRAMEF